MRCIILFRSSVDDKVYAVTAGGWNGVIQEFPDRDAAIAFVEDDGFGPKTPYQIVELDEL